MTFIVILIAVLVERFFDWSHLRYWRWFYLLQYKTTQAFPKLSPYVIVALTVLPFAIIVGLIHVFLDGVLYGFALLIFNVLIVLYCFGPQNLWANIFASANQLDQHDVQLAHDKLLMTFGITETKNLSLMHKELLNRIFIESFHRVFAIIFWYLLLGAPGVVIYRAIIIANDPTHESLPEISHASGQITDVLDWVPVRLYTFLYALGGHFVQVLSTWKQYVLKGLGFNSSLLIECGRAAIGLDSKIDLSESGSTIKQTVNLIDRVLIITLILIALGSFIFW